MDKKKSGCDVMKRLLDNITYYGTALIFIIVPMILSFEVQDKLTFVCIWICIAIYIFSVFSFNKVPSKFSFILWCILILSILYFSIVINFGTIMFFMFPASLLTYQLRKELKSLYGYVLLSGVTVSVIRGIIIFKSEWYMIIAISLFLIFMIISMDMNGKRIKMKEELNKKNEELAYLSGEIERNRISQDLHDSLGHVFSTLSVKAELASKLLDISTDSAKKELVEIHELSKASLFKVRDIINNIQNINMEQEIMNLKELLDNSNIALETNIKCILNPEVEYQVIMIIRELINNVIKHSNASYVNLNLTGEDDIFFLTIIDDGIGLQSDTHLKSISERAEQLDGSVSIETVEKGTLITIKN
ncbi:sensor histidine kinase [Macrococcoides canis]|uniref:sensor histidine kinase n=1 Tax=Macrococcoides canis TaxID=1855823 RepID=UPI00165DD528|nr:histidine kinase [Macrococcus canis]QNR07077.1 hypothetical protein GL258_01985 [Macrococcus canis]